MDMEFTSEVHDTHLTLVLSGTLAIGSKANLLIDSVLVSLRKTIGERDLRTATIDCSELDYRFGDSLASIWITLARAGIDCTVVATGDTREAIERLMDISVRRPIVGPRSNRGKNLR